MSAPLPRSPDEMLDSLIWRVTHSAYWLSCGLLLLFALVYFWRGQTLLMALEGVAVVGMTLGYFAGLRLRRAMLALDSIAVVNWLTLVLLAMMSGGLRSPAIVWLVVLPPMVMLAHPRLAAGLAVLTVTALCGLYVAHLGGHLPDAEMPLFQRVVSGAVITSLCALFAWHAMRWRLRLADELQAARDAAIELNRRKDRFIAHLNHEIRTPVSALLAGVQMVGRPQISDEERSRWLNAMQHSAEHLLAMVNDVLDHARLEAGEVHLDCVPFSLREVVQGTLDMLAAQAQAKHIKMAQTLAPDLQDTRVGDPLRLRQILLNLLSNAIKFTPDGGRVWLALAQQDAGGPLVFEIRDTGPGMDAELQARLFRPYEQGDAAITRRFGGTGLGLSISRELLTLMGGTVAEMAPEPHAYVIRAIEEFAPRIFMVHFRNIKGGYLDFAEVFPDEGDVDMNEAIRAYQRSGYKGILCPDHVPLSDLDPNRERFMSFALGYTRGLLHAEGYQPKITTLTN